MAFYDNFLAVCSSKQVTPTQVRKSLGISQSTMASWKSRSLTPKYGTVKKIADHLQVDWTELVPEEEQAATVITHIKERLSENSQWAEFMAVYANKGYEFTAPEAQLVSAFNKLNLNGQGFVITMTENMTRMPRYMLEQDQPPEASQDPPEDK